MHVRKCEESGKSQTKHNNHIKTIQKKQNATKQTNNKHVKHNHVQKTNTGTHM